MVTDEALEGLTAAVAESDYDWADSETVAILLTAGDEAVPGLVNEDDTINSDKLTRALKDFAIENSYLVKDPAEERRFVGPHGPSGGTPTGRYKYRAQGYDERTLRERYPALR